MSSSTLEQLASSATNDTASPILPRPFSSASTSNNQNMNNNNSLTSSGVQIVENITSAVGNSEQSRQLHIARDSTPLSDEPFHRDSRAQAAFMRKCAVFAGLLGTCSASAILSWRRYGRGFVARSSSSSSSSSIITSTSGSGDINNTESDCSFLQRYLITPLLLPAALGVSFVVVRGTLFEREFRSRERAREEWELANYRQGEIDEMVRIYMARGIPQHDAETLVKITSKDDQFFVDLMMTDELGFSPVEPPNFKETLRAGAFGALSYLAAAIVPLIAANHFDFVAASASAASAAGGGDSGKTSTSSTNDNRQLSFVPEGVLSTTTLLYSLFQARMLLRSYTVRSDTIQSVVCNCGWIAGTYYLTKWSCGL